LSSEEIEEEIEAEGEFDMGLTKGDCKKFPNYVLYAFSFPASVAQATLPVTRFSSPKTRLP
jgi:hypothetical protein